MLKIMPVFENQGYIAGTGDGIVSVGGVATSRKIYVLDVQTLAWLQTATASKNGNYLVMGLNPDKRYLLMCRDLAPDGVNGRYEPYCWDYVTPMNDKTLAEQDEMWQEMVKKQ